MPISHIPEQDSENTTNIASREKKKHNASFQLTEPKYGLEDAILSPAIRNAIEDAISLVENNNLIFNEWGLGQVVKHHNLCINLYGPSGTGKTMTAHGIARQLKKKMVIVNYAEMESKYVGETSKNIAALFQFAEENDAVILFDEADAMLSKRVTSMQSAADVSVNQTRNTLLKILDDYTGIVVFTTNFIQNFDMAFFRRILSHIRFEMPDEETRRKIWTHYLLPTLPLVEREAILDEICKVDNITGADISNTVLKSAIKAARYKEKITLKDITELLSQRTEAKQDMEGKYEIKTRKVSAEYAMKQLDRGESHGVD